MSKSSDIKKLKLIDAKVYRTYMFTILHLWVSKRALVCQWDVSSKECKLGLIAFRPNLLSMPQTLGSWTDGCIHVGTGQRHVCPLCRWIKVLDGRGSGARDEVLGWVGNSGRQVAGVGCRSLATATWTTVSVNPSHTACLTAPGAILR